ncbi:sensor histidine kinase [Niabella hibiscisoli]|uniref:sensor histidine kinase n=1 Tax=Niabella hibiscisoli TaxID=1825928 RepID=UPI001F0E57DE|nr:sensor histidine kinase [Niabella hibiscisoli]MCH5719624.1 sensor histidine kinase [Niabella hibiscisoli]
MRTLLTGIEKERQRIAQELHDGSGVSLSTLKMKLHLLKDKASEQDSTGNINDLMKEVDRIYEDIRSISHNLMPKTLSKLGLYPALDELLDQFRIAAPQTRFHYYRKTSVRRLNENATINIFRIIQELLTNIVKHANANEVSLQLIDHPDALVISVEDDGIGFDTREVKTGIGITSLESRVQMLAGSLYMDSSPQNGTFVSVSVPLKSLD